MLKSDWNATAFFENLVSRNRLARSQAFTFCKVSGLEGFEEAIAQAQSSSAFICVSDIADGYTEINNTPHTRRVKTVFLAMRHAAEDMDARNECMEIMRELFRQLASQLILEKVKLEQNCIYLDPRISFNEIDRYFFSGCACAYFQIAVDVYTDLRLNAEEWCNDIWILGPLLPRTDLADLQKCAEYLSALLGIGLDEASSLVENAPSLVLKGVDYTVGNVIIERLKDSGYAAEWR